MADGGDSILEMNRREFVRLTLMSSAMIAVADLNRGAVAETSAALDGAPYAVLTPLAPGAIRPEGWLRLYLERQAAQLGSQLPEVSWPFTEPYWAGEEQAESWWPWEQKAYWLDGATRLALVLGDQKLLDKTRSYLRYTLDHPGSNGYLGPKFFEDPVGDYHRWPQNVFFRGLAANSDAELSDSAGSGQAADLKRDAGSGHEAIRALHKHYLNDKADYGKPIRNITNVEDILWCYQHTGDDQLLEMAERAWNEYMTVTGPGPADLGDLSQMRVYAATPINAHGVTYAEIVKQPAILYLYTGKEEYLRLALAAQRRIFDHHMLIDGIPSTTEWFRTRTSLDSHETCDIADHTWSWGYMLMATGDARWADAVERGCLNAGFGAIKKDWKALQYFSCPNQFLATIDSDHNVMEHGGFMMAYQPNPGRHTACCGGNVHRMLPNFVIRMWMRDGAGGLAAVLYGPSRVKTTVGAEAREIEIVQRTDYPFGEEIHLTLNPTAPVVFPLSLRIPGWCSAARLAVNGKPVSLPQIKNGFATLRRRFSAGDTVTLTLPMKTALSHWPQNGVGLEHGPLVYSLPIKESWTPVAVERYTTAEFPGWNALPASAWNYGLEIDEARLHEEVKLQRKPMTKDPWVDPPVTLRVPAKSLASWQLQANPDNPEQLFTPPLPESSAETLGGEGKLQFGDLEELTLAPYGSTHLRVTIFPRAERAPRVDKVPKADKA